MKKENKNEIKNKKIIYIIALIVIIVLIVLTVLNLNSKESTSQIANENNVQSENDVQNENTLLSKSEKIVVGDNLFLSQLNNMYLNPKDYKNKTVEIEGFYLSSESYKFVARYGAACCPGDTYIYMEYRYDEEMELVDIEDWIKVTGTVELGMSDLTPFVYIKATSVEKMDIRGNEKPLN